jgi:hypothetical protein
MTADERDEALERLLDRTLRELPGRRAPLTLETRVFEELSRRAALPWFRRSFSHWPLAARAVFLLICAALIRLAFLGGTTAAAGVHTLQESGALSLSWARQAAVLMGSASNLAASLAHAVPPAWLYGGVAVGALLYAFLFGLGAAVYRTLYLQPQNGK